MLWAYVFVPEDLKEAEAKLINNGLVIVVADDRKRVIVRTSTVT